MNAYGLKVNGLNYRAPILRHPIQCSLSIVTSYPFVCVVKFRSTIASFHKQKQLNASYNLESQGREPKGVGFLTDAPSDNR
jgi:hypothetical protein